MMFPGQCISSRAMICFYCFNPASFAITASALLLFLSHPQMRGLQKETAIKRRCAVIISNMSKLVNNPHDAHLFLPTLLPRLEQAST